MRGRFGVIAMIFIFSPKRAPAKDFYYSQKFLRLNMFYVLAIITPLFVKIFTDYENRPLLETVFKELKYQSSKASRFEK